MSNKLSTTTIQGIPREFNAEELEALQTVQVNNYLNTSQSKYNHRAALIGDFLNGFAELYAEGYRLSEFPIQVESLNNSMLLTKPDALLQSEIEAIKEKVRLTYIDALKAERENYKSALVQQLRETAEAKKHAEEQRKQQKQLEEYEKQAQECFGELVIPD
jgi:septal ring factor EnvC (AmiA/AmiB activator)